MKNHSVFLKKLLVLSFVICFFLSFSAQASVNYDTLRPGDENENVKQMQEALNDLGYKTNGIDGKYGTGTVKAVEAFQKAFKLKVDGIAGKKTLELLFEKATLRYGTSNSEVTKLQQKLKDLGYSIGSVDGKYGPSTKNAVKAFQRKNGLKADGVAGTNTLNILYSNSASGSGSNSNNTNNNNSSILRFGDISPAVSDMQKSLTALGYDTNGTEGKYGKGTQRAVEAFQRKNGLKPDGIAGSATLSRLYSGNASSGSGSGSGNSPSGHITLRFGDNGSAVKEMQKALNKLGFSTNGTDGKYGTSTREAVKQFQKANKLTADGVAGSKTLEKLYSGSSNGGSSEGGNTLFARTLRKGYKGDDVEAVQSKLITLNYLSGSPSRTYDNSTINAVKVFQKAHGLSADGLAGQSTFNTLFGTNTKPNNNNNNSNNSSSGPNKSDVQLLHWYNDVKPSIRSGQTYYVYHPGSKLGWNMKFYSLGRHADSEPLTANDTANMNKAFGSTSWDPKVVYLRLPNGQWTLATMHNTPHLSGSIKDNNFNGHLCVHFLRDMSETEKNDPNYGVANQKVLRNAWKSLTGQAYVEKY